MTPITPAGLEGVGLSAKRGLAARGLHEALISRNRSQPQGYGDPAADRLGGGQHQNAWALPYTAVEVWIERSTIRDDTPTIAVAVDPAWESMLYFWPVPQEYAGHQVEL